MGFGFHSTELTVWPWVSHVTPASQMVSEDSSKPDILSLVLRPSC